jgi:hypothetical protein
LQLSANIGRLPLLMAVVMLSGCAPPNVVPGDYNANTISQFELLNSSEQTAYDVIRKLRPNFLNYQAQTTVSNPAPGVPVVYLNERFGGDLSVLNQILVSQVQSIRFYKASDAMIKYGTDRTGGVIAITLKER